MLDLVKRKKKLKLIMAMGAFLVEGGKIASMGYFFA